jgi:glycosyltransferase involved in cell wall biosynthesis
MKVAIRQVRGNSGSDIWAENLCHGLHDSGHECSVNLYSPACQFLSSLARLHPAPPICDIVQSNSWNGFAFKNEAPLVVTEHHVVHDPAYNPYRTLPQKAYHRWIYRSERKSFDVAEAVTCVSQYTKKKLEESFGLMDSQVIYNGIDTTVFKPIQQDINTWELLPHNKTVLFFSGNLSRRKGADLLTPIMKQLGEDYLLLLATGQRETHFLGMKNIINIGHQDLQHLVMAYNRCDIFLSASRLEGFGLSVAEAMACGKPVVATNGSSLPELVIEGKGGFLCRMDDVKDFADKIRQQAADEELRREMGSFNRKRVEEQFTITKMTEEYLKVYHRLVQRISNNQHFSD